MSFKIEIDGSSLIITDTISGDIVIEVPKKNHFFNHIELPKGVVKLYDIDGTNIRSSGIWEKPITECVDSILTPFTEQSLRTFQRENMGFNTAPGGSGVFLCASSLQDQVFSQVDTNEIISITNVGDNNGINVVSSEILFDVKGLYYINFQPQLEQVGQGNNIRLDMFFEIWNEINWIKVPGSNSFVILDNNEGALISVSKIIDITDISHKLRMSGRVSNTGLILSFDASQPSTPAIRVEAFKID